jgi:hypothetical protein
MYHFYQDNIAAIGAVKIFGNLWWITTWIMKCTSAGVRSLLQGKHTS